MTLSPQYLAGFLDGEGSVGFTRLGKTRSLTIRVTLTNTHLGILEQIRAQYGGVMARRTREANWKQAWGLELHSRKAETFLRDVAPYVVIKVAQVELAFQFWQLRDRPRGERCVSQAPGAKGNPIQRLKPEVREAEETMREQMMLLNKRGA